MALSISIGLLYLNQKTLEHRIREGVYGSHDYEAREIIQFVLDRANKADFFDGGKVKHLLPDLKTTETRGVSILEGVVA